MSISNDNSPEHVPETVANALENSSDGQLREIIHYAQQLLRDHPPLTEAIKSRPGEEIVHVKDHGAYTIVIAERPDETGWGRGPFAYRIQWESDIENGDGRYHWHYLGKVNDEGA
jgi:hypothetical protein